MGTQKRFDLVGGRTCLDFVNTMGGQRGAAPREELEGYEDVVAWAEQAGHLRSREARELLAEAARHPRRAAEALAEAVALREALHDVVAASIDSRPVPEPALATVNAWIASSLAQRRLAPLPSGGFALGWEDRPRDLLAPLRAVAASAAELLASHDIARVRLCAESAADRCGWLFVDETKNATRRFCENGCCNRAKARRHYARSKAAR